jgi:hypothetical protein
VCAADQIWRLVLGFPSDRRGNRLFMILSAQAAVDDSGSEPQSQFFVLGGFIASADNWAAFSDEWQAALDQKPRLAYFKMKEAARLKDQFDKKRGWTEELRDERIATLCHIIKSRVSIRIHAKIEHAHFNKHIRSLPIPNRMLFSDSPYSLLFQQLILAVAVRGDLYGLTTPCDFIFDEQEGFSAEVQAQWSTFKETLRENSRSDLPTLVGDMPIFRDEKCFLPLQAADLYAWQVRNYFTQNRKIIVPVNRVLRQFVGIPMIERPYEEDEIIRLREHLLAIGQHYKVANPGQKLLAYASDKRERRRARKSSRPSSK